MVLTQLDHTHIVYHVIIEIKASTTLETQPYTWSSCSKMSWYKQLDHTKSCIMSLSRWMSVQLRKLNPTHEVLIQKYHGINSWTTLHLLCIASKTLENSTLHMKFLFFILINIMLYYDWYMQMHLCALNRLNWPKSDWPCYAWAHRDYF